MYFNVLLKNSITIHITKLSFLMKQYIERNQAFVYLMLNLYLVILYTQLFLSIDYLLLFIYCFYLLAVLIVISFFDFTITTKLYQLSLVNLLVAPKILVFPFLSTMITDCFLTVLLFTIAFFFTLQKRKLFIFLTICCFSKHYFVSTSIFGVNGL